MTCIDLGKLQVIVELVMRKLASSRKGFGRCSSVCQQLCECDTALKKLNRLQTLPVTAMERTGLDLSGVGWMESSLESMWLTYEIK